MIIGAYLPRGGKFVAEYVVTCTACHKSFKGDDGKPKTFGNVQAASTAAKKAGYQSDGLRLFCAACKAKEMSR